jgi:hypothetical protein
MYLRRLPRLVASSLLMFCVGGSIASASSPSSHSRQSAVSVVRRLFSIPPLPSRMRI